MVESGLQGGEAIEVPLVAQLGKQQGDGGFRPVELLRSRAVRLQDPLGRDAAESIGLRI